MADHSQESSPRAGYRHGRRRGVVYFHAVAILMLVAGCAQQASPKYRIAVQENAVPVRAGDLGVSDADFESSGSRFLKADGSVRRLPTGLAVMRIAVCGDGTDGERHLQLLACPSHHAIYWNQLLDDLPAVREVVLPSKHGMNPNGTDYQTLLDISARLNCRLCLIYARQEESDADAEYLGVLWDAELRKPIASVRSLVILPPDAMEADLHGNNRDQSTSEEDYRAEQAFRRHVREVLWSLAERDDMDTDTAPAAAPATIPSPWRQDDVPIFPRDYERYQDSRSRHGRGR